MSPPSPKCLVCIMVTTGQPHVVQTSCYQSTLPDEEGTWSEMGGKGVSEFRVYLMLIYSE